MTTTERAGGRVHELLTSRRAELYDSLTCFLVNTDALAQAASLLTETLRTGNMVLLAGNGGSAAEAQHFAAELVGRFKRERDSYAALALTADTAILTAVANDYGYADVFARQVLAFGHAGDLLCLFSTSGSSENIIRAARAARQRKMHVVVLTGEHASDLAGIADVAIRVPARETALVQELHLIAIHTLCTIIEDELILAKETSTL